MQQQLGGAYRFAPIANSVDRGIQCAGIIAAHLRHIIGVSSRQDPRGNELNTGTCAFGATRSTLWLARIEPEDAQVVAAIEATLPA